MDEPSRIVRTNMLRFSWNKISGANKVMLVLSFTISLLQIIITSIILGIGGNLYISCDKPLQLYLIIFVIRVGVSIPFTIYQHLVPKRAENNNQQNENNNSNEQPVTSQNNEQRISNQNNEQTIPNQNNEQTMTNQNYEQTVSNQNNEHTLQVISNWIDRIKTLLDLFAIIWFIVGNYLVFSPSDCSYNASTYFYTILAWVLFGYLTLIVPTIICISVILCLPCVLGTIMVTMRTFNINIDKKDISKIPIFKYKSSQTTKQSFFLHFFQRSHKVNYSIKYPSVTISPIEDAVCSICLSQYEDEDLLCKLWCNHYYHKDCVHEWLRLNSTCPLCKRDFRGKEQQQQHE